MLLIQASTEQGIKLCGLEPTSRQALKVYSFRSFKSLQSAKLHSAP